MSTRSLEKYNSFCARVAPIVKSLVSFVVDESFFMSCASLLTSVVISHRQMLSKTFISGKLTKRANGFFKASGRVRMSVLREVLTSVVLWR